MNRSHNTTFPCLIVAVAVLIAGCVKPPPKILTTRDAGKVEVPAELKRLARTDHIALLERCLENSRKYKDFTCTFTKQEWIGGALQKPQRIEVKFLARPFSVAMKWTKNPPLADRILYVEGKYDGNMLVRPKSAIIRAIVGQSLLKKPDGPDAMKHTLRPVSMFGFERGIKSLLKVYRLARENGDLKQSFAGYARIDGRDTIVLERLLPKKKPYPAGKTRIYIDLDYMLPTCIEGYDWKDRLTSQYIYKNLKFNVGLAEKDFLPENNAIEPPKKK